MVRVFVAIELEQPLKRVLLNMIDGLSASGRDVRWVRQEQMHLTLKFLGDVPDEKVAEVCDVCSEAAGGCRTFPLAIDRCGCFPPQGRVRVIWGGMATPPAELIDCARRSEEGFEALGYARESRPFSAHMTIGRVRNDKTGGRLRGAVQGLTIGSASQTVERLTVFQSTLQPSGAQYTVLGQYPLGCGS
ncbi:MAG: RNA 2',3'-cyclic phosphodiesterase [Phycisphaerae bacterium]